MLVVDGDAASRPVVLFAWPSFARVQQRQHGDSALRDALAVDDRSPAHWAVCHLYAERAAMVAEQQYRPTTRKHHGLHSKVWK